MRKRLLYIISFFAAFLGYFILQKPCFMLYNDALGKDVSLTDFWQVIYHAFTLDATTAGYLTAIPWLVILISIWFVRFPLRKVLVAYYVLVAFLVTLIFVGDMGLYPFWNFKLDASVFFYLDSPKNAMASVSNGFLAVRLLLILALSSGMSWMLFKLTPTVLPAVKKRPAGTGVFILIGGALFVIIRGGVTESTSNIGQVYYCNNEFLNHSAVNPAFSLLSSVGKTKNYAEQFNFFPEAQRDSLFKGLYPTTEDSTTIKLLHTQRPNVLIILMEGFGATMVESLGGVKGASPNIDRLSKEGVWFTNCYANSFRTDRGTVCTFSGYQSFPDLSVMKIPAKSRTMPSIVGKLTKEGYRSDFLYGGDINFTNMKSYLMGCGYQHLKADVDFPISERQNPWGVNDDITFDDLYKTLKGRTANDMPWHTAFLTLSSHEPFEVPFHQLEDKKPNAFAFTDHHLGKFIDRMKELPVWNNLLIICLPDHGFYYPMEGYGHDQRIHHIPMLWLGGAVKQPMVIDKLMNQTDMAATLMAQLGIEHQEFDFSRNVLGDNYTYPFAYWSFGGGAAFKDSTGVTIYDLNANRVIQELPEANENRLLRLKAILQSSYDNLGER